MAEEILAINDLVKYFTIKKGMVVKAVDGVNLTLYKGETLGLVGESGSGKSTVAYNVIGLYAPTSGSIVYHGKDLGKKRRSSSEKGEIQIVFQDPGSSLNPRRTISDSLAFPLKLHGKVPNDQLPQKIEELLETVGLPPEYRSKYPRSIGGGERQLVCVARALASNPSIIVLDEPTSALDVSIQAKVIRMLLELQRRLNLSYLFITHDLSLMRNMATRVAIMYLGKICEQANTSEFFQNPLHPYTRMLLSAIPVVTEMEEKLKPARIISKGEIPSPVNIPPGCSFHLRCNDVSDICQTQDPAMVEVGSGHFVRCHKFHQNQP